MTYQPAVSLRPTMASDLDAVVAIEQREHNRPFITPWDRTQHEGALRIPDFRHFIIELGGGTEQQGFVILQGCRNPHRSVELKRIVLEPKGQGLGRACVRLLKRMAFDDLKAHRFWLDVKQHNTRAQSLYRSEGFVEEGRLRDSVRLVTGGRESFDSLIVMSLLEQEYRERAGQGLEAPLLRAAGVGG